MPNMQYIIVDCNVLAPKYITHECLKRIKAIIRGIVFLSRKYSTIKTIISYTKNMPIL